MVNGFAPGEMHLITSGQGASVLEQLDNLMTSLLFANGQCDRFKAKFLLNYHTKINYWTQHLSPTGTCAKYHTILLEIYEILDTWIGGWTKYWQHVSPVLFPYMGEDPQIKMIETLMK